MMGKTPNVAQYWIIMISKGVYDLQYANSCFVCVPT
jgi:hypothetical protein